MKWKLIRIVEINLFWLSYAIFQYLDINKDNFVNANE